MRYVFLIVVLVLAGCVSVNDDVVDDVALDPDLHGNAPSSTMNALDTTPLYAVSSGSVNYFEDVTGYEAYPDAPGSFPGVVLIHEWWGLNDNIRDMADLLASQGYHVLAVDLYDGRVASTSDEARSLVSGFDSDRGLLNLRSAVEYLRASGSEEVASLGWCFGGGQSLRLGLSEELSATIIYYGGVDVDDVSSLDEPVLGVFGAEDESIPVSSVRSFESRLDAQGTENSILLYEGAGHAFANPSGDRYVPSAAQDAWEKTLVFLDRELHDSDVVEIDLTGEDYAFFMDGTMNPELRVPAGSKVRLTFSSTQGFHDVVIDDFAVRTDRVRPEDGVTIVEFVADTPGRYAYYCSVGSHRANGMEGTFVVES